VRLDIARRAAGGMIPAFKPAHLPPDDENSARNSRISLQVARKVIPRFPTERSCLIVLRQSMAASKLGHGVPMTAQTRMF